MQTTAALPLPSCSAALRVALVPALAALPSPASSWHPAMPRRLLRCRLAAMLSVAVTLLKASNGCPSCQQLQRFCNFAKQTKCNSSDAIGEKSAFFREQTACTPQISQADRDAQI